MAIICPTLTSIEKDECLNNIGGLKLKVSVFESKFRTVMTTDDLTGTISALTYEDVSAPVLPISITFHKNTATLTESNAGTAETANQTNTVTVSITVNNREYKKSRALTILGAAQRELDLVVSQANGTNWLVPNAVLTVVDSASGAVKGDGSNYVLTFTAELDSLVYGIEDVDVATLISTGTFA